MQFLQVLVIAACCLTVQCQGLKLDLDDRHMPLAKTGQPNTSIDPCIGVVCPPGWHCKDGRCVKDSTVIHIEKPLALSAYPQRSHVLPTISVPAEYACTTHVKVTKNADLAPPASMEYANGDDWYRNLFNTLGSESHRN